MNTREGDKIEFAERTMHHRCGGCGKSNYKTWQCAYDWRDAGAIARARRRIDIAVNEWLSRDPPELCPTCQNIGSE
ncbi:MAG: hypothetical protein DWQ20_00780 [Actinobacteria bacterium]|nr:MAG: hypothetical protein DWQ20_00780 [Actinomycetota bacterium]